MCGSVCVGLYVDAYNKNPECLCVFCVISCFREHVCQVERAVPSVDDSSRCLL